MSVYQHGVSERRTEYSSISAAVRLQWNRQTG